MTSEDALHALASPTKPSEAADPPHGVTARSANEDAVRMVRCYLDKHLDARPPTLSNVAHALAIGERTLQRRLREAGTSFQELRQDVRCQRLRNLRCKEMGSDALSRALGFSDARCLRRWRKASEQSPPTSDTDTPPACAGDTPRAPVATR
ncbi:MAG: helix-turn-helix domain-containing protein [Myxococcales bacterium]|nr:helix-turn-helix domain-containing protein [Myxococcales bacterium]MDD9968599.1 helix-turn-helix domain-containing protein [Myxococcales bacterium]